MGHADLPAQNSAHVIKARAWYPHLVQPSRAGKRYRRGNFILTAKHVHTKSGWQESFLAIFAWAMQFRIKFIIN